MSNQNTVVVPKVLVVFNFIASRKGLMISVLVIMFLASLARSIYSKDFTWLSAWGGVATIFGLLLTVSHSVPKTQSEITRYVEQLFPDSRDGVLPDLESDTERKEKQAMRALAAERILKTESLGMIVTIIGTLVWAYAGFLTPLIWPPCQ